MATHHRSRIVAAALQTRQAIHAFIRVLAILVMTLTGPAVADSTSANPCTLELGPRVTVTDVINSETLALSDGRRVRLIGALGPRPPLSAVNDKAWPAETQARAALEKLVLGRDVRLGFADVKTDRYGHLLAHVFAWQNDKRYWVQGELLAHGHARAYARPDQTACIDALLAHEKLAQTPPRGIWRMRAYRILKPEPPAWLLANRRHAFEIIEGRVQDVAVVRGSIYLNFGKNWRHDFTAATTKKSLRDKQVSIETLIALKGRPVRVRGWIERRNGPFIELADPRLIEIMAPETKDGSDGLKTPDATRIPPHVASGDASDVLETPLWIRKRQLPLPRLQPVQKKSAR